MNLIRVVLVDDHPVVRSGIHGLLAGVPDIEVVGEASTGEETLRLVAELRPAVVLLDMELPDMQGTRLAQLIHQNQPGVKILVLSAHDDAVYIQGLLELGAAGYLMKDEAPQVIIEAVRGVARGQSGWFSRNVAARVAAWVQDGHAEKVILTQREKEVLRLLVQGKTNQAIAADLVISEKTVEKYIRSLFTKLNVASRVEAAVHAVREGLV